MCQTIPAPFTAHTPVLTAYQAKAEIQEQEGTLHLGDLRCHSCARRAEEVLRRIEGVRAASIGLLRDRASVRYDARRTSEQEIAAALRRAGYEVGTAPRPARAWRGVRLGISAVAFINLLALTALTGPDAGRSVGLARLGLSALVLLVSGMPLFQRALQRQRSRFLGRERLASGAALAAFALGLVERAAADPALLPIPGFAEGALAGDTFAGGAFGAAPSFGFEAAAGIVLAACLARSAAAALLRAARAHLAARDELRALPARRLREGGTPEIVPSAALAAGDRVRVVEGEQIPSDLELDAPACVAPRRARGLLVSSQKKAGEVGKAGTVLLSHEVTGRVIRGRVDLSRAMDEAVHQALARIHAGASGARAGSWSAIAQDTVIIAAQSFALFALLLHSWLDGRLLSPSAILAAIAVLVSASTAAFSLAAPMARAIAVLRARAAGVVVKDVSALERLADADVACLDKPLAGREGAATPGGIAGLGLRAKDAVRALWKRRVGCRLLSSAPRAVTAQAAQWLGVPGSAGLGPEDKARAIAALQRRGARVLLISGADPGAAGAAAADVTVALAPGASPAAVGAPIVVSQAELDRLPGLLDLARALRRRLAESAALSMIYNALVIPAAALGWITPLQAAGLLLLETMLGLLNAARLLRGPDGADVPEREVRGDEPGAPRLAPAYPHGGASLPSLPSLPV